MRKREGPSLTLRKRKTWTSPIMPLKARQHQGPVQMSGCCDTSQKEAVSQWKPGGQRKNRLKAQHGDVSCWCREAIEKDWIRRTCCSTQSVITSHINLSKYHHLLARVSDWSISYSKVHMELLLTCHSTDPPVKHPGKEHEACHPCTQHARPPHQLAQQGCRRHG